MRAWVAFACGAAAAAGCCLGSGRVGRWVKCAGSGRREALLMAALDLPTNAVTHVAGVTGFASTARLGGRRRRRARATVH
jgi:hypothetical protein